MGWTPTSLRSDHVLEYAKYCVEQAQDVSVRKDVLVQTHMTDVPFVYYAIAERDGNRFGLMAVLSNEPQQPVCLFHENDDPPHADFPAEWIAELTPTTHPKGLRWRAKIQAQKG